MGLEPLSSRPILCLTPWRMLCLGLQLLDLVKFFIGNLGLLEV